MFFLNVARASYPKNVLRDIVNLSAPPLVLKPSPIVSPPRALALPAHVPDSTRSPLPAAGPCLKCTTSLMMEAGRGIICCSVFRLPALLISFSGAAGGWIPPLYLRQTSPRSPCGHVSTQLLECAFSLPLHLSSFRNLHLRRVCTRELSGVFNFCGRMDIRRFPPLRAPYAVFITFVVLACRVLLHPCFQSLLISALCLSGFLVPT